MNEETKKFKEQTKEIEKVELKSLPNQDLDIKGGGSWFDRFFKSLWLLIPSINPNKHAKKLERIQTNNIKQASKLEKNINDLINKEYTQTKLELKKLMLLRKELKIKEQFSNTQKNNFRTRNLKKKIIKQINEINSEIKLIEKKVKTFKKAKNKLIEFKKEDINKEKVNDIHGDLLFLIRQNKIEIYNDIQTGIFEIDNNRQILIDPAKRKTMKIANKEVGVFIGSENSFTLFEQDPIHDSYMITQHLRQVAISLEAYKNIRKGNKSLENITKYLMYIILGGMAIYGGFLLMGVNLFHSKPTSTTSIQDQVIHTCWKQDDMNNWTYTCKVPDSNIMDVNGHAISNTITTIDQNRVYLGNGYWSINGVKMYMPDTNINYQ